MSLSEESRFRYIGSRNCGRVSCSPSWKWSPPPLADFDIWYVCSGSGKLNLNGEDYSVSEGTCFVLCPGDRIRATQNLEDRLTVIFVHFSIEDRLAGTLVRSDHPVLPGRAYKLEEPDVVELVLKRMLELEEAEEKDDFHMAEFDCLMRLFNIHLTRSLSAREAYGGHRQTIRSIVRYVRRHVDRPVSHQELADAVNLSARYMNRLFKRHTGKSVKDYLTETRMNRARHLLAETSMTVTQIAESIGYSDVYYFSKQFKKQCSVSPTRFRAMTGRVNP